MSLQIPVRSGPLRRLLLLSGSMGLPRPYSSGDRRRRVIREARQDEEEDNAFLRTLNFGSDPETTPFPYRRGATGKQKIAIEKCSTPPKEVALELLLGPGEEHKASSSGANADLVIN